MGSLKIGENGEVVHKEKRTIYGNPDPVIWKPPMLRTATR